MSFLFSGRYAIENVPRECAWTSVAGGNNLESFLELDASIFARFAVFSAMLSDRENSRVTRLDGDAISARSAADRLPEIVIVLDDMRETVATRAFGLDGLGIGSFFGHLRFLSMGVARKGAVWGTSG